MGCRVVLLATKRSLMIKAGVSLRDGFGRAGAPVAESVSTPAGHPTQKRGNT